MKDYTQAELSFVVLVSKEKYLPPHLRKRLPNIDKRENEEWRANKVCLRIENLSDDTTEYDLWDLFGNFGYITRVNIPYNESGQSRCFGYVEFVRHEDAISAQKFLDGYGFANLILHVEFASKK